MADNPQEQFEKKVLIALEATTRGMQDALDALEQMKKHLGGALATTKQVEKATKSLSTTFSRTSKNAAKLTGTFKSLRTVQKGLYETTRRIGNVTRSALGAATVAAGAFFVESKRIGNTMLQFEISSLDAADALNRLGAAYGGLRSQASTAVLSIQDVAAELTKFQSQGIAQMSVAMNEQFMEGWRGLQSTMTQVMGKADAGELMGNFVQSLGDEFKELRSTISGELKIITERIQTATDPKIKVKNIDEAIDRIKELRLYTSDQGTAAQMVIATMTRLREAVLGGGSDMTQAVVAINAAWARFGTQLENLSVKLVETFGPDLARLIDDLGGRLQKDMAGIINRIARGAEILKDRFVAWGGTERFIQSIQRALDVVYKTLATVIEIGGKIVTWFVEANTSAKILGVSMAAIVLAPGLVTSVFTLAKGLRLVAIEGAAAAAAAKGLGGFAAAKGVAAGLAGRTAGLGLLAGVATVGHIGGKAAASYAGAERGGTAEILSGAAGAATAGAMIGSIVPGIGTAAGAAIAGIGSIVISGIKSWRSGVEEAVQIEQAFDKKQLIATERSIRELKKEISSMTKYAVSGAQKVELAYRNLRLEEEMILKQVYKGELTEIEAEPALSSLRKQIDDKKKIKLGVYEEEDETYLKRITDAEKKRTALILKSQLAQGKTQGNLVKEIALQNETIKKLERAGKLQAQINRLLRERTEVLQKQGTGISDAMIAESLRVLQEQIDELESKKLTVEVGVDAGRSIDDVMSKIKELQDMQAKEGFDFGSEDYIEKVREVRKSYNQLRSELSAIEGGQFDEQIKQLDIVFEKTMASGDGFASFVKQLEDIKVFSARTLPGFTAAVGGMVSIIDTLGPATEMFGQKLARALQDTAVQQMAHGFEVLRKSADAASTAFAEMQLAENEKEAARWTFQLAKALEISDAATKALQQSLEATLKPLQKQLEVVSAIKEIRQLDLDISQQLYGTPALAVQAQLELVKTMQAEKETLEAQLATTQSIIAQAKARGSSERDIFFLRIKELELSKNIRSVTRDQLRQVKELRDGYLDAVQAQALGAGRFSKILITQEQNLMRGLQKAAVKQNFLLGQYAEDAAKTSADAYRFSAQGMGFLETMGGQVMQPEEIAQAVYDRVANIADPLAAASALESADIWMNIVKGADKNTQQLASVYMLGSDRIVDAISAYAETRLPRGAAGLALRGAPAGEVAFGAALDRFGRGLAIPPPTTGFDGLLDAKTYREQARKQGSALASIEALLEYRRGESLATPDMLGAPPRPVKPELANLFFAKSLQHQRNVETFLSSIAGSLGAEPRITITAQPTEMPAMPTTLRLRGKTTLQAPTQAIEDLKRTDREIKRHEMAHKRAAGPYAIGRPKYRYQDAPDGRRYAIGGQVLVDLSPIPGDPKKTIEKMQRIKKAALAPRRPSEQDVMVARTAGLIEEKFRDALEERGIAAPVTTGVPPIWISSHEEEVKPKLPPKVPKIGKLAAPSGSRYYLPETLYAPPVGIQEAGYSELAGVIEEQIKHTRGNTRAVISNVQAQTKWGKTLKEGDFLRQAQYDVDTLDSSVRRTERAVERSTETYRQARKEFLSTRKSPYASEIGKRTARSQAIAARQDWMKQRNTLSKLVTQSKTAKGVRDVAEEAGRSRMYRAGRMAGQVGRPIAGQALKKGIPVVGTAVDLYYGGKLVAEKQGLKKDVASLVESQQKRTQDISRLGDVAREPATNERERLVKERNKWSRLLLNLDVDAGEESLGFWENLVAHSLRSDDLEGIVADLSSIGPPETLVKDIRDRIAAINQEIQEWDIAEPYRERVATLETLADQISKAERIPVLQTVYKPVLDKVYKAVAIDADRLVSGLISDVETEALQSISNVGPKLLEPHTRQLADTLTRIGEIEIELQAPDADVDTLEKELQELSRRAQIKAGFMKGTPFGDLGFEAVNEAIDRSANALYEGIITPHLAGMEDSIEMYQQAVSDLAFQPKEVDTAYAQKILTGIEKQVQNQFDKMAVAVGAVNAEFEMEGIINDYENILNEKLLEESESINAQIASLRTVDTSRHPGMSKAIETQIKGLREGLDSARKTVADEISRLRDYGKSAVEKDIAPKIEEDAQATVKSAQISIDKIQPPPQKPMRPEFPGIDVGKLITEASSERKRAARETGIFETLLRGAKSGAQGEDFFGKIPGAIKGAYEEIALKGSLEQLGKSADYERWLAEFGMAGPTVRPRQPVPPGEHHPAFKGVSPLLTAVDTDEFEQAPDWTEQLRATYGKKAEYMIRRYEKVQELNKKINQIDQKLKPTKDARQPVKIGFGEVDLHGFEIPGTAQLLDDKQKRRQLPLSSEERERLQKKRETLKKLRDKQNAKLDETRLKTAAKLPSPQEQAKLDDARRQQQRAAEAKYGTSYIGEPPARLQLDEIGKRLRPDGPQTPDAVRGRLQPIRPPTRTADPGRVHTLTHGISGNWQNKARNVSQRLQQAGQIIEEMGSEMDQLNDDQNNITQYAGNRLLNVQAVSP